MAKYVKCEVCGQTTGSIKQHLKDLHGYIYTKESPNYPIDPGSSEKEEK